MHYRLILVLTLFLLALPSQAQSPVEWIRLSAGDSELELSAPRSGLVLHEPELTRMALDLTDAWFTISLDKRSIVLNSIKEIKAKKKDRFTVETKKFGHKLIKIQTYDWAKSYSIVVSVAGEKYAYRIYASAATKDNESFRRFLGSVRISGQAVFPDLTSNNATPAGQVWPIEKLSIAPAILDSLKKPDASPQNAKFAKIPAQDEIFDGGYSRRLFLTRQPKARYTDKARTNGIEGTVRAYVEFRSDGTIGSVTIDPSLDMGLARQVANAISMLKFVPAEIDGRPVSIFRLVSYTFDIY